MARLEIVTPEGVPLPLELATVGERLLAFLIDYGIMMAVLVASTIVTVLAGIAVTSLIPTLATLDLVIAVVIFILFVVRQFYFIVAEARWHGATLGKWLVGVRVVAADGASLELSAILARNVLREVELLLPIAMVMGRELLGVSPRWLWLPAMGWILLVVLLPLITRRKQRAGDLVAGTLVVRVPAATLLDDEAAVSRRSGSALVFTPPQLAIYGEHELETLAVILRDEDAGRANETDLQLVALTIARKIRYEGTEPRREPARFLREFYRAQRAKLEDQLLLGRRKSSKFDQR